MAPLTEELLHKLVRATEEARATLRDLHAERQASMEMLKTLRRELQRALEREAARLADDSAAHVEQVMKDRITEVIDGIEKTWRSRLGI